MLSQAQLTYFIAPPPPGLPAHDIEHCESVCEGLDPDTYDGPETIMLSTGYALIWIDGDVTQNGQVVHQCEGGW